MKQSLSKADVIVCYLSPAHMAELGEKLRRELKQGTIVCSQGFPIPEWRACRIEKTRFALEGRLYCYKMGESDAP